MYQTIEDSQNNNIKLCECNCGKPTKLYRGKFRRFISGHNSRGKNAPNYKGIKDANNGYILVYSPNHPFRDHQNYVLQHRLIYENYLKILFDEDLYLKSEEEIHHIDGNKRNNTLVNLMYFPSKSEHRRYESIKDMSNRRCIYPNCKTPTITWINKNGHAWWYCYLDGFICKKCYSKNRNKNKRNYS